MAERRAPRWSREGLKVERDMVWCDEHLEPFRARWPTGFLVATLKLLDEALERPDVRRRAGRWSNRLGRTLWELGPVCCLIAEDDPELVAEVTRRAIAGDPKLVAEVKQRDGARRTARWDQEREARKSHTARYDHPT